jgi:hypothetical protein
MNSTFLPQSIYCVRLLYSELTGLLGSGNLLQDILLTFLHQVRFGIQKQTRKASAHTACSAYPGSDRLNPLPT